MSILAELKTIFSADTSTFRKAVTDSMNLVDQFADKTRKLADNMKTMNSGKGNSFRSPDTGQFTGVTAAMETYHAQILGLEADIEALKSGLNTVNAPLRQNGIYALMSATSAYEAADATRVYGAALASIHQPAQQSAHSLAILRANAVAVAQANAPIGFLTRQLRELNLVNFATTKSVEYWDVLGVMRGPGRLVEVFDKVGYYLRGIAAPMRQLQYLTQVLLVPALAALSNALTTVANNPAASVLSRNLAIIGSQLVDRFSAGRMLFGSRIATALGLAARSAMGSLPAIGALSLSITGLTYTVGDAVSRATGRAVFALGGFVAASIRAAQAARQTGVAQPIAERLAAAFTSLRASAGAAASAIASAATRAAGAARSLQTYLSILGGIYRAALSVASATAGGLVAALAGIVGVSLRAAYNVGLLAARFAAFAAARAISGAVQGLTQSFVQLGVAALQAAGRMAGAAARFLTLGLLGRRASGGIDQAAASMRSATTVAGGFRMGLSMIAPALGMFLSMGPIVGSAIAGFNAAKQGMNFAADTEQTLVAYTTMLGGATDKAQALNAEVTKFSSATPFQLPELRGAAKTLLGFNVAQQQIVPTMKMLGEIAAGTGKPIGELADKYGKMKARGVADMEALNGFMEAGAIDAEKFAASLGMTREALFKAVENKQVTFGDVQRQLIAATSAGGKFNGMLGAQSQTVSGLLSTLKDNVNITLGAIGEKLFTAFNVRGVIASMISLTGWIRETMVPAVFAAFDRIVQFLTPFGIKVFQYLVPYFVAIADWIQTAFLVIEFAATHWRETLMTAAIGAALGIVRFGAIAAYTFTEVVPAYLRWFWENWRDIFTTVLNFTTSVLTNIGKNITDLFTSIYNYLASGGTAPFEFAFTPLLDGFENTIRKMPEVADRVIGSTESNLAKAFEKSSGALGAKFADFVEGKKIAVAAQAPAAATANDVGAVIPDAAGGTADAATKKKGKAEGELKALEAGSAEAFKAAFGKNDDKVYRQNETAIKQRNEQNKNLRQIADNTKGGADVVPAF